MNKEQTQQIQHIWDNYIKSDKKVLDTKGNEISEIDKTRNEAIVQLKEIINQFNIGESNIYEFKTNIDSFNKRNNLWGFTATKGQMFFNQLVKYSETKIDALSELLKDVITQPKNLSDSLR